MINRTTLSIVVLTSLFTILSALSTAPQSCYAQPLPKSGKALTDEQALDVIKKLWEKKSSIESWRKSVEKCVKNIEYEEITDSTYLRLSQWRREIINDFDSLAATYNPENKNDGEKRRSNLYNLADKKGLDKGSLKIELLQLFQEAFLLQQAICNVHCKCVRANFEKIYYSNNKEFTKEYSQFLHNTGIDIMVDYKLNDNKLKVFKTIDEDFTKRCELYRAFLLVLTNDFQLIIDDCKDLEEGIEQVNKKLDEKEKELVEVNKQFEYLRDKLFIKFQTEVQEKIKQIQEAGEGTIDIPIDPFNEQLAIRFIYVCPGKYYVGNDEELNKKLYDLTGHSVRKFGMNEITIKSGFFIMEDKITPEQLQSITNKEFQLPNELTWKQAMESADKANLLLKAILNGMTVRLPTEIEWECAVRGKESKNLFPWGNENPKTNPDEDVTKLGIKHAASMFSEWCIDKKMDNYYGFDGTVDKNKEVSYFPKNDVPYFTYYCIGDTREHKTIIDHELKSPSDNFRVYKGASDEDLNRNNLGNRAISSPSRSTSLDSDKPNISFRFVLIPQKQ